MTHSVAFVSVGVGVGASQSIPLSVLARKPHKGLAHEISHETERRQRKARSQDKQGQSTDQGRTRTEQSVMGEADG